MLTNDIEKKDNLIIVKIDDQNIIISIDGNWDDTARKGKALEFLKKEKVLGKKIEHFLGEDHTKMFYETIFYRCRYTKKTLVRNYRCDSPTHERHMQVTLIPLEKSDIKMVHETIKEIPFKNDVNIEFIKNDAYNTTSYTQRCSVCNRLLYPNSTYWVFPEDINENENLYIKVINTVCNHCKEKEVLPLNVKKSKRPSSDAR